MSALTVLGASQSRDIESKSRESDTILIERAKTTAPQAISSGYVRVFGRDIYIGQRQEGTLDDHIHRTWKEISKLFVLTSQGYMLGLACIVFTIDAIHVFVPSFSEDGWSLLFLLIITTVYTYRGPRYILKADLRSEIAKKRNIEERRLKHVQLERKIQLLQQLQQKRDEDLLRTLPGSSKTPMTLNLQHIILKLQVKAEVDALNNLVPDNISMNRHSVDDCDDRVSHREGTSSFDRSNQRGKTSPVPHEPIHTHCPHCIEACIVTMIAFSNSFYVKRLYRRMLGHRRQLVQVSTRLVIGFMW